MLRIKCKYENSMTKTITHDSNTELLINMSCLCNYIIEHEQNRVSVTCYNIIALFKPQIIFKN